MQLTTTKVTKDGTKVTNEIGPPLARRATATTPTSFGPSKRVVAFVSVFVAFVTVSA